MDRSLPEELKRSALELDVDLGVPLGHALSGAQIERNAGPSPVVNVQLQATKVSVFDSGETPGSER